MEAMLGKFVQQMTMSHRLFRTDRKLWTLLEGYGYFTLSQVLYWAIADQAIDFDDLTELPCFSC